MHNARRIWFDRGKDSSLSNWHNYRRLVKPPSLDNLGLTNCCFFFQVLINTILKSTNCVLLAQATLVTNSFSLSFALESDIFCFSFPPAEPPDIALFGSRQHSFQYNRLTDLLHLEFWTALFWSNNLLNLFWVDCSLSGNSRVIGKFFCSITVLQNTSPTGVSISSSPLGNSGIILSSTRHYFYQLNWQVGLLRCGLNNQFWSAVFQSILDSSVFDNNQY